MRDKSLLNHGGVYNAPKYTFTAGPVSRLILKSLYYVGTRGFGLLVPGALKYKDFEYDSWFNVPSRIKLFGALESVLIHQRKEVPDLKNVVNCANISQLKSAQLSLDDWRKGNTSRNLLLFHDVNIGEKYKSAPTMLYLNAKGGSAAAWVDHESNGLSAYISWFPNNTSTMKFHAMHGNCYEVGGSRDEETIYDVINLMIESIQRRSARVDELTDHSYFDVSSHEIHPSSDGSVVVYERRRKVVDNPYGPSIITTHGKEMFFSLGWRTEKPLRTRRFSHDGAICSVKDGMLLLCKKHGNPQIFNNPVPGALTQVEKVDLKVQEKTWKAKNRMSTGYEDLFI